MVLWGLEKGLLSWESEGVPQILYQAFLDGLAQEWCEGNFDNDELVIDGRKALVERGRAPAAVSTVARNVKNTGNPFGLKEEGMKALVEKSGGNVAGTPEVILYFGSTARLQRPQSARALIKVLRSLKIPFETLKEEPDSGFLSYQLGDFISAAEQARKVAVQLKECRAKKFIVLGASDYRMFTTRYSRFGAALPEGLSVSHVTEFLSRLLEEKKLSFKGKLRDRMTYHDPCNLARFTYVIEPPRKILAALAGENFVEMEWHGRKAHTCGGCGGVPFTYPDLSAGAAQLRIEQALRTGAKILISADPSCEEMLSRVGKGVGVKNIVELIADEIS
jgi:Fe-S oxidoreductase